MRTQHPLLNGPYPVKIIAHKREKTRQTIFSCVNRFFPAINEKNCQEKITNNGNYISITIELQSPNETDLLELHTALKDISDVVMVL